MTKTARVVTGSIAVLAALGSTAVMAPTALAADSTAVRSDARAISMHAAYEAGSSLEELVSASSLPCEVSITSHGEHWWDVISQMTNIQ
jgi:hypothetical protein